MDPDRKNGVKLMEQIGAGGFGKIYKCLYWGQEHALKKVPIAEGTYTFRTVMAEFMVLSQVKHPRIVNLITFYQTKNDWNFVLEFMKNGSLRGLMKYYKENQYKLNQNDLLAMFMDVAVGVKYLHSKGIIHRDIKPENVLMDENYRMKIADFGIAKLICTNKPDYHTSVGTMLYMSPEVFMHQPYDKSADIWALGVVFYEMAMLNYPFTQADKARIMNPKLTFVPPKIDCIRRKYSTSLQDFLELMIQRDPKKRADLSIICRNSIVEKIYIQLNKEEACFNNRK